MTCKKYFRYKKYSIKMPNLMHEFVYVKRYYCLVKYMNLPSAKKQT